MVRAVREWVEYLNFKLTSFKLYIKDPDITKLDFNVESDLSFITMEEYFLTISFAIRKLFESKKIKDEFFEGKIKVKSFPRDSDDPDEVYRDYWHHYYDLKTVDEKDLELIFLCNQFIHSFIFVVEECLAAPYSKEKYLVKGVYVNSDWTKDKELYFVDISDFIAGIQGFLNGLSLRKIKLV